MGMEAAAQKVSMPAASTQVVPVAARSEATQTVFVVEDQDIGRHTAPCGQQYATHVDRRATSELFAAQLGRGSLQGSHPRVKNASQHLQSTDTMDTFACESIKK